MERVMVVGAGVIGLSCAVVLAQAGYEVNVMARDLPLETTSAVAAALWYPYLAQPPERVDAWAAHSYARFVELSDDPATGVTLRHGTELLKTSTSDPSWCAAVPGFRRVADPPAPYVDGSTCASSRCRSTWAGCSAQLADLGGTVTRMSFARLPTPPGVVVNATGLGARALASDQAVEAVRGQVLVLEQIGITDWWLDESGPPPLPRSRDLVLGGTIEPGEWSTQPNPDQADAILTRVCELVPALADRLRRARVIGHKVGRRPARPSVRLEREKLGASTVIHCYGHGGSGVSLSWGCANEVLSLLRGG